LAGYLAGTSVASQYWVAYEGNDVPENFGWEHHVSSQYGGADRQIQTDELGNSYLVIDSRANQMIYDFCQYHRALDPEAGELFVATWRLRIDEAYGYYDTGLGIAPDGGSSLGLGYYIDHIVSSREGWSLPFTAGQFHTYRIESTNMVNYRFWLDDQRARDGVWDLNSLNRSFVDFGDVGQGSGARSLAEWDYLRFGVVPECDSAVFLAALFVCQGGKHR
jgi:hypothetical protein